VAYLVALVIVVVVVVFIAGTLVRGSSTSGGGASSALWIDLESQLYEHAKSHDQNVTAGNLQGALDARTKVVADCQQGASMGHGTSSEEAMVRQQCDLLGYPIP
jgi:hypothetical protein